MWHSSSWVSGPISHSTPCKSRQVPPIRSKRRGSIQAGAGGSRRPLHRHRHASRARCRNGFLSIFAIRPANWPFARICNSTRGKTTVAELLKDASPYADACRQGRTEPVKLPPLGNAVAEFAALEDARRRCGYARQGERNYRCGSLRCRVNFTSRSLHVDKGAAGRRQGSAGLDRRRHRCAAAIGLAVL